MHTDHSGIVARPSFSRATAGRVRRRARRSAPLVVGCAAGAAAAAFLLGQPRAARADTFFWTGGNSTGSGTGTQWFVGSDWNTVDGVYNASSTTPTGGSDIVFDSTCNASSYIGGTSATSDVLQFYASFGNIHSLTFGNASSAATSTPQLPTTLYIDNSNSTSYGGYTETFNGGTGAAGGTDLLTLTNAVGAKTVDIRGGQTSGGTIVTVLVLASSGNLNVANASSTLEIDTRINQSGGAYGITKTGAGLLYLNGVNSNFSGGVTVAAGTLEISGGSSLGAVPAAGANLTFAGNSTLLFSSAIPTNGIGATRAFNINAGVTATINTQSYSYSMPNPVVGAGSLVKAGTGTLALNGTDTYTGTTTVNAGTLQFNSSTPFATSALTVNAGGTLTLGSAAALAAPVPLTLNGGTLALAAGRTAGTTFTSTTVGGTGASTLSLGAPSGTATVALGAITRAGNGTLDIAPSAGTTVTTTTANGTGAGNAGNILGGYLTYGGGATFAANDGAGNIVGLANFTTDYAAANTTSDFDATTSGTFANSTVSSLRFNAPGTTVTTNGALTVGTGGILVTPNTGASTSTLAGGTVTSGNGTDLVVSEFGGPLLMTAGVTGSIALTKAGTGTLILDGANAYTGATAIQAGTLQVGNGDANGALSTAAVVDNGVLAFNQSTPVVTSGNQITGTGSLRQDGNNTLVLTQSDSYAGGTVLNAGTIQFATTNNAGTGGFTFNGGTLRQTATLSSGRAFAINAAGGTIDASSGTTFTLTGTGAVSGTGPLNINNPATNSSTGVADTGTVAISGLTNALTGPINVNAGQLTLTALTSSYAGAITVNAGTLYGYYASSFGNTSTGSVTVGAATVVVNYLTSLSTTLASTYAGGVNLTSPASTVQIGNGNYPNTTTLTGTVAGTGTLNKTGPGTLNLTAANTYAGGTNVTGGILTTTVAGAYGTGDLTINPTGTAIAARDNVTVNASTGSLAATANVTVLSSTTDFNATSGAFGIGTLNVTGPLAIGSLAGNGVVALGANALTVGGTTTTTFTGTLNGAGGSLVKAGTGTLTLSGTGTYTGGTTVTGGTLALASATAFPANTP